MMQPLLTTRFHRPRVPNNLIVRTHLIERLNCYKNYTLALISAPAGYGKTTLLASWLAQPSIVAAWLRVNDGNEDPLRFYRHLLATLHRHWPTATETAQTLLDSPQAANAETFFTLLLNDLADHDQDVTLVIDDYHLISDPEIHNALGFLLDNAPPNVHLIVSSRTQPPWPLAKLRAIGMLAEFTLADLAFSDTEAETFLHNTTALPLSSEETAEMVKRAEGWITGLQLTALAHHKPAHQSSPIIASNVPHRYVADYLWDEILQQQPAAIRTFLYETAFFEELTSEFCEAVTHTDNAQAIILHLERHNLFIIALDNEERWFRYHHLFRDYLRVRARQELPEKEISLYQRAAEWYAENRYPQEAIDYGLRATAFDWVAQQIMAIGDRLWTHAEMQLLQRWTTALPASILLRHPKVALLRGWASAILGDSAATADMVQIVESWLASNAQTEQWEPDKATSAAITTEEGNHDTQQAAWRREIVGILAILQSIQLQGSDPVLALQHYSVALENLPSQQVTWQSAAYIGLAFTHQQCGDLAAAKRAFTEANRTCLAVGNRYGAIYAQFQRGQICLAQGLLTEAEHSLALALQQTQEQSVILPIVAWPHLGMGLIHYEKNNLSTASTHLLTALRYAKQIDEQEIIVQSLLQLARVKVALYQWDDADQLIRQAQTVTYQTTSRNATSLVTQTTLAQIHLALAQGEIASIVPWMQGVDCSSQALRTPTQHPSLILLAQALWQRGEALEASLLLDSLLDVIPETYSQQRLTLHCLQACVLHNQDETTRAVDLLLFPLQWAVETGHRRLFLDYGKPMAQLLHLAATHFHDHTVLQPLCHDLLRLFVVAQQDIPTFGQALIEPISATELAILRLLALGLSNQQIADTRVIAITTVKWHLKNIYGKLGVRNRTAAVTRAQELALLQSN